MEFIAGFVLGFTFLELLWIFAIFGVGISGSMVDSTIAGLVSIALFFTGLWFFYDVNLVQNLFTIFIGLAAYFVAGGLWTLFVSWPEFLDKNSTAIRDDFMQWQRLKNTQGENASLEHFYGSSENMWKASSNVQWITGMITTWFFEAIWRVLSDPLSWAWNKTYELFSAQYERVSRRKIKENIEK